MNTLLEALLLQLEFINEDAVAFGITSHTPEDVMVKLREFEDFIGKYVESVK